MSAPAICLNMIVRNEAHIVRETLDSVARHISSWAIVDTGSDDGTPDLITKHMEALGIPGQMSNRPWRDFGHNRTEALTLAQGHGDYIWVVDADDILFGAPDFSELEADVYSLRMGQGSFIYWRPQLFRDGLRVQWHGVVHEAPRWAESCAVARLAGDYHVESRRLGARSRDHRKYERDRDVLLAEVGRNPADARSVFYLAQTYSDLGDFVNARSWYARRVELVGWDQEVYVAMQRVAESMAALGEPWPDVHDAYLRAWEFRPSRAEALYALARRCRVDGRYRLGYLYAAQAAEIPLCEEDLFVDADVHRWRAIDEQAVCAGWIGEHAEAFSLNRTLLARDDIPDDERKRVAANRDFSVPAMIESALAYPDALVQSLAGRAADTGVTVSVAVGRDPAVTERTLNSFLNCCTDVAAVGRFVLLDTGLSAEDRSELARKYPFAEFLDLGGAGEYTKELANIQATHQGRHWLHLGEGWQFFAPENLITRLRGVFAAERHVLQVAVNLGDATALSGASASEKVVHRTAEAGRYVLTDTVAQGPAMFDTERLDQLSASAKAAATASLDEVFCVTQAD